MNPMQKLLDFLCELNNRKIFYKLSHARNEAIMVEVAVPGERWEVEFFADSHVEVEVFGSNGVKNGEQLSTLLNKYGD
jgi:hypothetical protein